MIGRIDGVQHLADTAVIASANAYRSPLIPSIDTNAIQVQAASLNLLGVVATTVAHLPGRSSAAS